MDRPERRSGSASGQGIPLMLREAQALLQQRKREEAADIYRRILKNAPNNLVALFNLGKICHDLRDLERAAYCFEQAIKHKSDEPQFKIALAFVKADQQELGTAIEIWESVKGTATSPKLLVKLGTHLRILGRLDEAKEFFNESLATDPMHIPAYQGLSMVTKLSPDAPEVARMIEIEKKGASLPLRERSMLAFVLGNIFLDHGDGDSAFSRLETANKLRRETYPQFELSKIERYADNIISLFDAKCAQSCAHMSDFESERPVFITGMPRSGSTLTEQVLAAHPDVASLGETDAFTRAVPVYENAEMPGLFSSGVPSLTRPLLDALSPAFLNALAEKYISLTDKGAKKSRRATDKMLFNFMWTGLILAALPKSHVIRCTRDPIDTGLSIWRHAFLQDIPWAYDMREIGRFHRVYDRLSKHWDAVFPQRVHEANYETMVAEQEKSSRALVEFCGLPWDDACLSFYKSGNRVHTASATQVRQPIYKSSAGKWKAHEKYLAPLIEALEGKA